MLLALSVASWPAPPPAARAQDAGERQVFTYFYYWYAPPTGDPATLASQNDLTNHFPPERPGDWRSVQWYRTQLSDMRTAGVDVALAVYWGNDLYPQTGWSTSGLEPMVQALDELAADGKPYPHLGLFLDTYVLEGANLTDPNKINWLGNQIRAFFKRVPERHRATQDGRPIIWLYLSNFANDFNPDTLATLNEKLGPVLGAQPFWVADTSWSHTTFTDINGVRHPVPSIPMTFDAYYRWGAASLGTLFVDYPWPIASVGPGYDDTGISWRGGERSSRPRESGCFYARNWRKAQVSGARWVAIETWDELFEGSGIAETVEWGRDYIKASTAYTAAFKRGDPISLPPACPEVPDASEPPADDGAQPAAESTPGPTPTVDPSATPPARSSATPSSTAPSTTPTAAPSATPSAAPTATPCAGDSNKTPGKPDRPCP